jgi:hypothetical protein
MRVSQRRRARGQMRRVPTKAQKIRVPTRRRTTTRVTTATTMTTISRTTATTMQGRRKRAKGTRQKHGSGMYASMGRNINALGAVTRGTRRSGAQF